eukprot:CAMPEP_0115585272 /NCGR_PEP_ID=MMETSP0272-20121206/7110_1 /TAXON_ID=71861 /ORGANISM="Scrippsiella trochoidea, Strain CCMP3099" /LENGTH=417 /DNA_ID=CAMNT_0003020325 /DNA_START=23 /DNA_END=1273 /DNA_ORIENTATION=-
MSAIVNPIASVLWGSAWAAIATAAAATDAGARQQDCTHASDIALEREVSERLDADVPCRCPFDCSTHFTGDLVDTEFSEVPDQCLKLIDVVSPSDLKVRGGSGLNLIVEGAHTVIPGGITLEEGSGNLCILNGPHITGMIHRDHIGKWDAQVRPGQAPRLKIVRSGIVNLAAGEGTVAELIVEKGNGRIEILDTLVQDAKVKVAELSASQASRQASEVKLEGVGSVAVQEVEATLGKFEILGCAFAGISSSKFSSLSLRECSGNVAVSNTDVRSLVLRRISGGTALEANVGEELVVSQNGGPVLVTNNSFDTFLRLRKIRAAVDARDNTLGEFQVINVRGNVTITNNTLTSLLVEKNRRVSLLDNSWLVLICTANNYICGSTAEFGEMGASARRLSHVSLERGLMAAAVRWQWVDAA